MPIDLTREEQFVETLRQIHNGALVEACGDELADAVQSVRQAGGEASITITIKVAAVGENRVNVSGASKFKPAKMKFPSSIFYFRDDNTLTRNDPRQVAMFDDEDGR